MKVIRKDITDLPNTNTPFLSGCRKLLEEGEDINTRLEMYRGGIFCLGGKIGECAKWTVLEEPNIRFAKYRPPQHVRDGTTRRAP